MKIANPLNFAGFEAQNMVIHNLVGAPAVPKPGQVYFDGNLNCSFMWNGLVWRPLDASKITDGSIPNAALQTNPLARGNHTGTQTAATISDFATAVKAIPVNQLAAATGDIDHGGHKSINVLAGTNGTDGVNFSQMTTAITAAIAGQTAIKNPVKVIATANIALAGLQTIDGILLVAGDRVLTSAQTTLTERNIYVAAAGAWALATDADAPGELIEGTEVLVNGGTVYAGTIWRVTTTGAITPGVTNLTWTQTAKINTYTANGATLLLTGFQFSVKIDGTGWLTSSGNGIAVDKSKVSGKYSVVITGDALATSFVITHNLNTTTPSVTVRDGSGAQVLVDNVATSANVVTLTYATAPAAGTSYSVSVQG